MEILYACINKYYLFIRYKYYININVYSFK